MKMLDALEKSLTKSKEYSDKTYSNALKGKLSGVAVSMDDVSPVKHKVNVNTRSKNLLQTINGTYDNDSLNHYKITVENGHYEVEKKRQESWAEMREFWTQMGTITLTEGTYRLSRYNNTYDSSYGANIINLKNIETGKVVGGQIVSDDTSITITVTEPVTVAVTMYTYASNVVITYPYTYSFDLMLTEGTEEEEAFIPSVPNDTAVTVKSCGKNLIPYPYVDTTKTTDGITFTDNGDGSITIDGTATNAALFTLSKGINFFSTNVYLGAETESKVSEGLCLSKRGNVKIHYEFWSGGVGTLFINCVSGETFNNVTVYPQIEYGTVATPWEPYIEGETIETILKDGAQLNSISPNMTITTDTSGVVIDTEYNKDSNIVIEKLTQAIISLGGNV